jgi:tetratricopeptide (TPR) repeat protein
MGDPVRGDEESRLAVEKARQSGHSLSLAFGLHFAVITSQFGHHTERARALLDELIVLSEKNSFELWLAGANVHRGTQMIHEGKREEGLSMLNQALRAMRSLGTHLGKSTSYLVLTNAHLELGQLDEAIDRINEGVAFIERTGERFFEPEILRVRVNVLLQARQVSKAEAVTLLHDARALAQQKQMRLWELKIAVDLYELSGGSDAERAALQSISDQFPDDYDFADIDRARGLLAGRVKIVRDGE